MQIISGEGSPLGWVWDDDWHLDKASSCSSGGWAYAPDQERLRWPESYDAGNYVLHARQRRWIRNRKRISSDAQQLVSIGILKPGESTPLPLACVTQAGSYVLLLRPLNFGISDEYAWSKVVEKPAEIQSSGEPQEDDVICVSDLVESEKLLYCEQNSGTSSRGSHGMWFCLSVQATEIAKDIRSDPIQDWCLVVKSPLNIANYLPLIVEYSILEKQASGHFVAHSRGIFSPGKAVNVYAADVTKSLFLSLLPQKGWLPLHVRFQKQKHTYSLILMGSDSEIWCHIYHNHSSRLSLFYAGSCSHISSWWSVIHNSEFKKFNFWKVTLMHNILS